MKTNNTIVKKKTSMIESSYHSGWCDFFMKHQKTFETIMTKVEKDGEYYPKRENVLRCFQTLGPKDIKVVLLGQDPYIGAEEIDGVLEPQACGLSFGVSRQHRIPPSLLNMFKEIQACYPQSHWPGHGCLERWTMEENIFLLNASLTVRPHESNSHSYLWSHFTDDVIQYISNVSDGTIFLLMGNFAKSKKQFINTEKHKLFETVHPSPLSSHKGFFGCRVFYHINEYLKKTGKKEIQWFLK